MTIVDGQASRSVDPSGARDACVLPITINISTKEAATRVHRAKPSPTVFRFLSGSLRRNVTMSDERTN